jgi:NAD(P)-dependent dehydrogenase (short-subunit alcohol dehydrogenase family)
MRDLNERVALVTGASRGLGAAIAQQLAADGAAVAINYFNSGDRAERMAAAIRAEGGKALAVGGDVRDEAQVSAMVERVTRELGPIDVLVINATGPQPMLPIEQLSWRVMLDQLEFFVKSPTLLAQAVVPGMKERRRGRIINIGSEVFEKGLPRFSNYVSAKGAQLGLTRSWAMELAEWGITVNHVSPGWIPTERHDDVPQEAKDGYAARVPLRRMGVPPDVAEAVAFLASDAAAFITGQKLSVNGGNSLE